MRRITANIYLDTAVYAICKSLAAAISLFRSVQQGFVENDDEESKGEEEEKEEQEKEEDDQLIGPSVSVAEHLMNHGIET